MWLPDGQVWFDAARHDAFLDGLELEAARFADEARHLAESDEAAAVEAVWHDVKRCVEDLLAALAAAEALRHARVHVSDDDLDEDARRALAQLGALVAAFRRRYDSYERRLDQEAHAEEAALTERLLRETEAAAHEAAAAGSLLQLDILAEPAWRQLMDASRELLARLAVVQAEGVDLDPEALAMALARRSEKMIDDAREVWTMGGGAAQAET